jgi:hypothetical protein
MMRARLVVTLVLVAVSHAEVRADVTITMTTSIEGPTAALAGVTPLSSTTRIQGLKARTDMEVMGRTATTITDVAGRQLLMLDHAEKIVRRMPLTVSGPPNLPANSGLNLAMPNMEVSAERTGRTEQMAGQSCEEFHVVMIMDISQISGALATPDARDAMKDMRMVMKGSSWLSASSPGAGEFITFQEAARAAGMALPTNLFGGQNAVNPLEQTGAHAAGLPCLSEIEMNYEGTGPMIETLRKMGTVKVTSRLTEMSLAPIAPDMFVVPAGYNEADTPDPLIPRP